VVNFLKGVARQPSQWREILRNVWGGGVSAMAEGYNYANTCAFIWESGAQAEASSQSLHSK
jgi:hypothetical protein